VITDPTKKDIPELLVKTLATPARTTPDAK